MPTHQDERDLQEALIAWQGGEETLPAGRADALLERLRIDETFRRELAVQITTLAQVRTAQAAEPRWLALSETLGLTGAQEDSGVNATENSPHRSDADDALDAELLAAVRNPSPSRARRRASWMLTVGALGAVVVMGSLLLWQRGADTPASAQTRRPAPLAMLLQNEGAIGHLGNYSQPLPVLGHNLTAGPLALTRGKVSLMYTSGVVLHVEGPARLELLTADRVLCHEGRVRLHVPPGAEGFCIETPGGAVTDLGTELGVSVGSDGNTQVAVFEGEAEASLNLPGQEGVRTELLTAHQSARLLPGTGEIVTDEAVVNPTHFMAAMELQVPPLRLSPGYEEKILAAKPVQYWRMDRLEAGQIPNEVAGAPALTPYGGLRLESPAPESAGGRGVAHFGGKKNPSALYAAAGDWSLPGTAHAVEMWFASTTTEQMDLIAFTADHQGSKHLELVELPTRQPGRSIRPGVVRFLTRWPAGKGGGINIYSEPKYQPFQWHHLVAQQSGGKMELYVNGRLAGRAEADAFPPEVRCGILLGCLRTPDGLAPDKFERPFAGKMAQVAIYDRLLTEREIRERAESRK